MDERFPEVDVVEIDNPSTNLLESVGACTEFISSDNFLWMSAGMFFQNNAEINRLVNAHKISNAFCTLFSQEQTRYKAKLVLENGSLRKFVVGEDQSALSTPTIFAVKASF